MPGQHQKKMRKPWDKDTITSRKAPRCVIPKRKYIRGKILQIEVRKLLGRVNVLKPFKM